MIDILNFIFASPWHFIGTLVLMVFVAMIVEAFGPFIVINHDKDLR